MTRLSVWQVFKREDWPKRFAMFGGFVWVAVSALTIAAILLLGVMSGYWQWSVLGDSCVGVVLGCAVVQSVYWKHRALEAEKPLPPTQAVMTYSTVGAADIARMVERQRRRECAETAGRTNA